VSLRSTDLQAQKRRIHFDVETLEREIRNIDDQLEGAEFATDPNRKEGSDWWHRARDAKRHKERQRRILLARAARLERELQRIKPDAILLEG